MLSITTYGRSQFLCILCNFGHTCSVCLRFTGDFAGRFFIRNKIFSQPGVKYFTNINQKCYFLL